MFKKLLYLSIVLGGVYADEMTPSYIHSPGTEFRDEVPPPPPENSIIGTYYNVLFPLDVERECGPQFDEWIRSRLAGGYDPFLLGDDVVGLLGRTLFDYGASRQVEVFFAQIIKDQLAGGSPFSLELALEKTEIKVKPAYEAIIAELQQKEESTQGGLSIRYKTFKESFIKACDLKSTLKWMIDKIKIENGCSEKLANDFIEFGGPSNLRQLQHLFRFEDNWEFRKKPVMDTLSLIQDYAEDKPYFFALQEVTPQILADLKTRFPELQWISYNNLTGKETKLISLEEESVIQESTALTTTIALSQSWKIEKIAKVWLSETPDVPSKIDGGAVIRPVLGIVATNLKSSKKIAIINTHADHFSLVPKVREVTRRVFNEFIDEITEGRTIPYIAGGDFNIFINGNGQEYYEQLKGDGGDYKDHILYAPQEIQKFTFLGLPSDRFCTKIDAAGNFEPNALDHIFYSKNLLDLQFSFRDAAACDKSGALIDPYKDRQAYVEALKNRLTASDHFANIIVIKELEM